MEQSQPPLVPVAPIGGGSVSGVDGNQGTQQQDEVTSQHVGSNNARVIPTEAKPMEEVNEPAAVVQELPPAIATATTSSPIAEMDAQVPVAATPVTAATTPASSVLQSDPNINHALQETANIQTTPIRGYLDQTVVPVLLDGMAELSRVRPPNPVEWLATYMIRNNPQKMCSNVAEGK